MKSELGCELIFESKWTANYLVQSPPALHLANITDLEAGFSQGFHNKVVEALVSLFSYLRWSIQKKSEMYRRYMDSYLKAIKQISKPYTLALLIDIIGGHNKTGCIFDSHFLECIFTFRHSCIKSLYVNENPSLLNQRKLKLYGVFSL